MSKKSKFDIITKLGKKAVREAQKENIKLGLPNVVSHRGKVAYKLADGRTVQSYSWV